MNVISSSDFNNEIMRILIIHGEIVVIVVGVGILSFAVWFTSFGVITVRVTFNTIITGIVIRTHDTVVNTFFTFHPTIGEISINTDMTIN
jgi:hypothetical protein